MTEEFLERFMQSGLYVSWRLGEPLPLSMGSSAQELNIVTLQAAQSSNEEGGEQRTDSPNHMRLKYYLPPSAAALARKQASPFEPPSDLILPVRAASQAASATSASGSTFAFVAGGGGRALSRLQTHESHTLPSSAAERDRDGRVRFQTPESRLVSLADLPIDTRDSHDDDHSAVYRSPPISATSSPALPNAILADRIAKAQAQAHADDGGQHRLYVHADADADADDAGAHGGINQPDEREVECDAVVAGVHDLFSRATMGDGDHHSPRSGDETPSRIRTALPSARAADSPPAATAVAREDADRNGPLSPTLVLPPV